MAELPAFQEEFLNKSRLPKAADNGNSEMQQNKDRGDAGQSDMDAAANSTESDHEQSSLLEKATDSVLVASELGDDKLSSCVAAAETSPHSSNSDSVSNRCVEGHLEVATVEGSSPERKADSEEDLVKPETSPLAEDAKGDSRGEVSDPSKDPEKWAQAPEFIPRPASFSTVTNEEATSFSDIVQASPMAGRDAAKTDLLCPYGAKGVCRYGENCSYVHGHQCDYCGLEVLHPTDTKQRESHLKECIEEHEKDMEHSFAVARSRDKTCGICMETVWDKSPASIARFGILENCNHIFCLNCIRKWRGAKQFDRKVIRGCPECRRSSDFVTPSVYWVDTKEEKSKLINGYKEELGTFWQLSMLGVSDDNLYGKNQVNSLVASNFRLVLSYDDALRVGARGIYCNYEIGFCFWCESISVGWQVRTPVVPTCNKKQCRHFDQGRGQCPFGEKCFYLHAYPDGRKASPKPPRRVTRRRNSNDSDRPSYELLRSLILYEFIENRDRFFEELADDLDDIDLFSWPDSASEDGGDMDFWIP